MKRELLDGDRIYMSKTRALLNFFAKFRYDQSAARNDDNRTEDTPVIHFFERKKVRNQDVESRSSFFPSRTVIDNAWLRPFVLREAVIELWVRQGRMHARKLNPFVTFSRSIKFRSNPGTKMFKKVVDGLKPLVEFPDPNPLIITRCKKGKEKDCCMPDNFSDICRCSRSTVQIDAGKIKDVRMKLGRIPVCMNEYKDVKKLFLPGQDIRFVENLDSMKKLQLLDLNDNHIRDIDELGDKKGLKYLFLNGNSMETLKGIDRFKKLESLDIRNNLEVDLETGNIGNLKHLKHFFFDTVDASDQDMENIREASDKIGFHYTGVNQPIF
jgi:hypothetical protein